MALSVSNCSPGKKPRAFLSCVISRCSAVVLPMSRVALSSFALKVTLPPHAVTIVASTTATVATICLNVCDIFCIPLISNS